jgi:hypothetical protein
MRATTLHGASRLDKAASYNWRLFLISCGILAILAAVAQQNLLRAADLLV